MDLSLNSEITRPEQYKLAWKAITSDNLAEAWNAKCWLTYRACDGEIGIDEWRQHVSVNTPAVLDTQIGYRWHVSQLLAEVYLHTLHGHPIELEQCRVALLNLAPRVAEWPFAGLNFLRNDALGIYQEYVSGRPSTQMIGEAVSRWTSSVAVTHPALHPRRYWEMGDDMEALRVIAKLANPHDATVPAVVLNPRRIFSKCLLKIGESAIDRGSILKTTANNSPHTQDIGKAWIVVCRHSNEFNTPQAAEIKRQFEANHTRKGWRFICLTDKPTEDWHLPLLSPSPGWWAIQESFRFKGPHVLTGLDTVLLKDLDPILDIAESCKHDELWGIRDFGFPEKWASGITIWNGDWSQLFHLCTPQMQKMFRGNQDFTEFAVKSALLPNRKLEYLQDKVDGIYSYKIDIKRNSQLLEKARVCCFHGKPRPWEVSHMETWLPQFYRE